MKQKNREQTFEYLFAERLDSQNEQRASKRQRKIALKYDFSFVLCFVASLCFIASTNNVQNENRVYVFMFLDETRVCRASTKFKHKRTTNATTALFSFRMSTEIAAVNFYFPFHLNENAKSLCIERDCEATTKQPE